jgi:PAS domain S-box-containing protein
MPTKAVNQSKPAEKKSVEKGPRKKTRRVEDMSAQLKQQKDFVETILNASVDLIAVYDMETRLITMNRQYEQAYGISKGEWIGKTFLEIYPDGKDSQAYRDLLDALSGELVHNFSFHSALPKKYYENFVIPLRYEDGEVYAALVMSHDNTNIIEAAEEIRAANSELKLLNEQLQRSEERYASMINEVEDYAIIMMDSRGIINHWNKGAEKIKGYTSEEILGKHFSIFYTAEDMEKDMPQKMLEVAIKEGKAAFEGWRVRKDGSIFWGAIVITALHGPDNNVIGFSKVTRDLTERKMSEDKLQMFAEELLQKNKELERSNSELTSFSYVASHDLQEPLRKIQGFGNLILNSEVSNLSDTGRDYFNRMIKAANRMQALIDSLLEFSRTNTEIKNFEAADLNELVDEVKRDLRELIESSGATIICQPLPIVSVIPFQFRQLMANLIGNSIKYARKDVPPVIEIFSQFIETKDLPEHYAASASNGPASYYRLTVQDNGIGFEEEYAEKIFELFQRLHGKNEYTGSGIGLAICKRIAENHGGWIRAESEPGVGSSFHVYLPVKENIKA